MSLLVGNGLTRAVCEAAKVTPVDMAPASVGSSFAAKIDDYAKESAMASGRGDPNIEDQIRAVITLANGLTVLKDKREQECRSEVNSLIFGLLKNILSTEEGLIKEFSSQIEEGTLAKNLVCSFLLSFASRTPTRERLNIFSTNYDRLVEYACDWIGLHIIDRFIGSLSPIFRASRYDVDIHYNPPGIRGEPRYLEGVVKLTKLHGSIDWRYQENDLRRVALPFGAPSSHPQIPKVPSDSVIIYPNPAKDMETAQYPYSELFRDFSAALCRPNSALITYGYGFGDAHINRVIRDMLSLPSTHLVIISFDDTSKRISKFYNDIGRAAQTSLLIGKHFGDLKTLVEYYLPKPAIDRISIREARLKFNRTGQATPEQPQEHGLAGSTSSNTPEGNG
ncbi:MAG: SIR2 family protein [Promethearchaeota archaeon]